MLFKNILKIFARIVAFVVALAFAYITFNYLTCPIYDFPEPEPFKGEKIYNPYQKMDNFKWRRGNFQIQSRAWLGITGGSGNTNEDIDSVYRRLGYEIITTSDYMRINRYGEGRPEYIPVYEHGYGIKKHHQVVIGASRVSWRDYPLFQTLHHKQHIIDLLKSKNELVFIAHPRLRHGWKPEDFFYLTGYDGIEVLNYMRFSIEHWDAALSSGRYATILGNDDAHDIKQQLEVGHRCTYVHAENLEAEEIIRNMENGVHYAADIFRTAEETWAQKIEKSAKIARIESVRVIGDTLRVACDKEALEFRFVGQGGKIMDVKKGGNDAVYILKDEDSYIRTEITFPDKNILYLNPVVRYDGTSPFEGKKAEVNLVKTWIFRIASWGLVLLIVFYLFRKRRRRQILNRAK